MSDITERLTRKLGPLPVWAWALIAGVVLFWYRRRHSSPSPNTSTGTGTVVPESTQFQPPTTLQPGESVYDPNTGALTTAPGGDPGGGGGGGGGADPNGPLEASIQALIDAMAAAQPGPGGGPTVGNTPPTDKRTRKHKRAHDKPGTDRTTQAPKPNQKQRSRSSSNIRNHLGGRAFGKSATARAQAIGRKVSPTVSVGTRRQKPVAPAVRQTAPTQRPEASHPKASSRPIIESPPRPSSPVARAAARTRTLPPPRKQNRPRGTK